MHPRNRHGAGYDFPRLVRRSPQLAPFVRPNPFGAESIDFADPVAVTALNRALLHDFYGIDHWQIPPGYLCPPVPGRADYIHHLADLLAASKGGSIPRGESVAVLDIGVGANCVYPIIGTKEYGWRFVGSDIDPVALTSARKILTANPSLAGSLELRLQRNAASIFDGIIKQRERFAAVICNPPFHASAKQAAVGTQRKLRNLRTGGGASKPILNFGGQHHELWCRGGEAAFVRRMITESVQWSDAVLWFSSLLSKRENLPGIHAAIKAVKPAAVRTIAMAQGQKQSRIVAWTFLSLSQHEEWRVSR